MKQQESIKKKKRHSKIASKMIVILLMLVGLALLLYPTVADKINNAVNNDAISEYQRSVQALSQNDYAEMLEAARTYNKELFEKSPHIGELTAERRKIYESLLDVTGTGIIGYIEIQKPHIYLAVYHGTEESVLQTGVGHLEASSLPVTGESVHTVLSGHSGLPYARLFTDLDQMKIGDTFTLHVLNETLTYRVEKMERVLPDTLKNLCIEEGQELCTLMTCTPYGVNTHRLVITGRRIEKPEEKGTTSVEQASVSTWNWQFVILPFIVFAAIVFAVVLIRKRKKKKNLSDIH